MRSRVIAAMLQVLVFWYVVLLVIHQEPLANYVPTAVSSILAVGIGFVIGYLLLRLLRALHLQRKRSALTRGGSLRGASISLGRMPPGRELPAKAKLGPNLAPLLPEDVRTWYANYKVSHPSFSVLFDSLFAMYLANKRMPASPVPGGHGGASLLQHSFNVMATIMTMAPTWEYVGHKDEKDRLAFKLIDQAYKFDPKDPLIPLLGFAHDVGKLIAFNLGKDGLVTQVSKTHDKEGGLILTQMPEFWALEERDSQALNLAVSFYHRIWQIPDWVDDRTRALAELLIAADIRAGEAEGESKEAMRAMYGSFQMSDEDRVKAAVEEAVKSIDAEADSQDAKEQPVLSNRVVDLGADEMLLQMMLDFLAEPNRTNGGNGDMRVALKYDDLVYVNEAKLREEMKADTGRATLFDLKGKGQLAGFTAKVMEILSRRGLLLQDFEGLHFTEKSALFSTVMHGDHDKVVGDWKFTLIFKASATDALAAMPSCKRPPKIVRCAFGNQRALRRGPDAAAVVDSALDDADGKNDAESDPHGARIAPEAVVAELGEFAALGASSPVPFVRRDGDDGTAYALFYFNDLKARYALGCGWDAAETLTWPNNVTIVAGKQDRLLKVRIPLASSSDPSPNSALPATESIPPNDSDAASIIQPLPEGCNEDKSAPNAVDILDLVETVAGSMLDDSQIHGQSVPVNNQPAHENHFKHTEDKHEYPF